MKFDTKYTGHKFSTCTLNFFPFIFHFTKFLIQYIKK